mgnify:CR=1 FL=1
MEQKPRGAMLSRRGFLKAAAATGAAGFAGASLTGIAASAAQAESAASETLGFTYHNEHCLCNCMLQCTVRDGRLAMIQPRENEDKRFQNVCLKGISEVQNIYGDARIQRPMKRVGERGSGEFEAISWDEAFQMIAENFKAIQDKYGKEALWIQFSTEASQRFPPLLASVLGAQAGGLNGYDMGQGNGQIMAFSPWIGMFAQNTMWEWPEANVVILANTNLVETSLTWSRGMLDAQEAGTKFICLDPRFSPTAGKADQWVNLRAGTDPAFFLGMTKYILDEELFDREHVLAHTALPFLIDAETGACLADVVTGTDPETGEPGVSRMNADDMNTIADELSGTAIQLNATTTMSSGASKEASGQWRVTHTTKQRTRTVAVVWPFAIAVALLLAFEAGAWITQSRRLL